MEGTVFYDQALTKVSVGYSPQQFISDQAAPTVPVDDQAGYVYVYKASQFRVRDDSRAPGAESKVSRMEMDTSKTFFCGAHSLKDFVPRGKRQAVALNEMVDTTENLTEQVKLAKEAALVAALIAGLTGTATASLAAEPWSSDTYDPVARVEADKETIGKRIGKQPNTLIVNPRVLRAIRLNANVRGLLTGIANVENARVTAAALAALLELDQVLVAPAVYDTVNEGQTATLDYVWPTATCGAILCYREPNPGLKKLTMAYTYRWVNALSEMGGPAGANGAQYVERYYWQPNKADVVEVHDHYDQQVIAAAAAIRYTNPV